MIYFIRHAQSQYNAKVKLLKQKYGAQYQNQEEYSSLKFSQQLMDADITQFGVQQCQSISQAVKDLEIQLVLVSPLRRALHTCQLLFKDHPLKPKIVVQPLIRQKLSSSCDIGSRIEESIKLFPSFDFHKITDKQAWYLYSMTDQLVTRDILQTLNKLPSQQRKVVAQRETLKLIKEVFGLRRIDQKKHKQIGANMLPLYSEQKQILSEYLKQYSKIAVISHSKCIKRFINKKITNAQIVALPLEQLK